MLKKGKETDLSFCLFVAVCAWKVGEAARGGKRGEGGKGREGGREDGVRMRGCGFTCGGAGAEVCARGISRPRGGGGWTDSWRGRQGCRARA